MRRSRIAAVFLVSAALHELAFGIATSRFDGYQAAFFLVQAPAVMLSPHLAHLSVNWGWMGSALARTVTVCWMGATSVLFFHGVDRVFPWIYVSRPWLP